MTMLNPRRGDRPLAALRALLSLAGITALVGTAAAQPTPPPVAPAPTPSAAPTPATSSEAPPATPTAASSSTPAAGVAPVSTTTPSPAASDPTSTALSSGGTYDYKLRELEERVIGLKEKVFRSKTRLLLLKERILNDVIAEAKVVIFHENDMGSSLRPVQVLYHLDGEKIYFQDDSSDILEEQESIEVFNQNLVPGNHVLAVEMIYRGDSAIFAYLKDYLFKLRANYTFYATKGKITTVRAIGYQRGDITYDLRERPSITFDVKQVSYTKSESGATVPLPPVKEEKD